MSNDNAEMASFIPDEPAPDFSELPDIVWVNVLSFLNLSDRCHVASTCHALNDAFNHPSTWHSVKISLLGNPGFDPHLRMILPDRHTPMVERFGGFFQNLTLNVAGNYLGPLPPHCQRVLQKLAERCRLETLTLQVGVLRTKLDAFLFATIPRKIDLEVLISFIANGFRLKNLHLKSWHGDIGDSGLLNALIANPRLKRLEKLSWFWKRTWSDSWVTLNAALPRPDQLLSLVQHFDRLRHISLQSSMLTGDLIEALCHSHHAPVEKLSVLITYSTYQSFTRDWEPPSGIPEIPSTAWKKLKRFHPALGVEFTIATRTPFIELAGFLKPDIPVAAIEFMKFAQPRNEDILSICEKYHGRLTELVSLADMDGLDSSLKHLVAKSIHLKYFVYHGSLNYKTVMEIAALRGNDWNTFEVMGPVIDFAGPNLLSDIDPDVVVIETAPGKLELVETVRQRVLQEEEAKYEERLEEMVQAVSTTLGRKWWPLKLQRPVNEG